MSEDYSTDTSAMKFVNTKPNYNITFHNDDKKKIGVLDFNGPAMTFVGDAEESARVFMNYLAQSFAWRLKEEREACAKICDDADKSTHPADLADRIRAMKENPAGSA